MDNTKIEKIAISALENIINKNKYLDSNFNSNDKEPSWDGNIYIYNSDKFSKSSLQDRIPVQIKGKVDAKNILKSKIKYSVNLEDLGNFYNSIGVIYFVVLMDEIGEKSNVFYNLLYPIKVKEYLDEAQRKKNKRSINIEFIKLAKKPEEMERIVKQFAYDSKKQGCGGGQIVKNRISINELADITEITGKMIGASNEFDLLRGISNGDVCIYGKRNDGIIDFPLEYEINSKIYIEKRICNEISIAKNIYYKEYTLTSNIEEKTDEIIYKFKLSPNIVWEYNASKFHFKFSGTIIQLKNDVDFLNDLLKFNYFYISDKKIDFCVTNCSKELKKLINYINDIYDIFNMLNI